TPSDKVGTTPAPYTIDTGTHVLWGGDINTKFYQAEIYLYSWPYILRRAEGIKILEDLAHKNLVAAMVRLSNYYLDHIHKAWTFEQSTHDSNSALDWALKAAKQGNPYPLSRYARSYAPAVVDLTPDALNLLNSLAPVSQSVGQSLSHYYEKK